jgi:hypothetical protein
LVRAVLAAQITAAFQLVVVAAGLLLALLT